MLMSSTKGAPQFAERSTKSQIGIPTSGRRSAMPYKLARNRDAQNPLKSFIVFH